jgi:hypothetical protein
MRERYIELPALISGNGRPGARYLAPAEMVNRPAELIVRRLGARNNRGRMHVLLEGSGGQGKSALLREITSQLIRQLERSSSSSIPLLCSGTADTIEKLASAALGRWFVNSAMLRWQLRRGHFLLVFDGLSEMSLKPHALREFLESEEGHGTAMLGSTRERPEVTDIVCSSGEALICRPQRLTDATVGAFLANYQESTAPTIDAKSSLRACVGSDGTYLQLLVRLALEHPQPAMHSVAELYRSFVEELFEREDLLERSVRLCADTYWLTGSRRLSSRHSSTKRYADLIRELREANILIPVNATSVKFSHDALQSYLTACALEAQSDYRVLERCAGDKRLRESAHGPTDDSELFGMCLLLVPDADHAIRWMSTRVRKYAVEHWKELKANDVLDALLAAEREAVEAKLTTDGLVDTLELALGQEQGEISEGTALAGSITARVFRAVLGKLWDTFDDAYKTDVENSPLRRMGMRKPAESVLNPVSREAAE